ncbi:hypothetical protein [Nocardia sp. NPDC003183]
MNNPKQDFPRPKKADKITPVDRKANKGDPEEFELDPEEEERLNQQIQKNDRRASVANSEERQDALASRAGELNIKWDALKGVKENGKVDDKGYRNTLRDALIRAHRADGSTPPENQELKRSWRGKDRDWIADTLDLDENDGPNVAAVKKYGRSFLKNRDDKNARATGGDLVGTRIAELYLEKLIKDAGGGAIVATGARGNETLDVVAVVGTAATGYKLVVIEAKAGSSQLQRANVHDDRGRWYKVWQGTRIYLRFKLRRDQELLHNLKTKNNGEFKHLYDALVGGKSVPLEYRLLEARYNDDRTLATPSVSRFNIGTRLSLIKRPASIYAAPKGRPRSGGGRSRTGAVVGVVGVAGAAVALHAAASFVAPSPANAAPVATPPERTSFEPSTDSLTAFSEIYVSGSVEDSVDNVIVAGLKASIGELARMATSFTNYVQSGLNELVTMVGAAVSVVSGFVSDVVDSVGAQAIIDKISDDWAFAQELLNIAMLFSPVGTVAAAISAAVPIIQLIVEHWDQIRAAFDWVLKNVLTPVAEFFMTAFKVYMTPYRAAFNAVMAGFNGMGGVVGTAVGTVRSTVVGIVKAIGQIFQRLEVKIPGVGSFGLKSVGDVMVAWASERMADGGLVGGQRGPAPRRASGIEVMAVIDRSVLRAAQAEERKIGYAYRPPFLHDGALPRTDSGPGPRTFDVRVADVDAAFAQIRMLQAVQDARFSPVGV